MTDKNAESMKNNGFNGKSMLIWIGYQMSHVQTQT
jgi:hypothetical protein